VKILTQLWRILRIGAWAAGAYGGVLALGLRGSPKTASIAAAAGVAEAIYRQLIPVVPKQRSRVGTLIAAVRRAYQELNALDAAAAPSPVPTSPPTSPPAPPAA
jgi:hypothetical protein